MVKYTGHKVIGTIISIKGHCDYGQKVGDRFELSAQCSDGLCGYLYYSIYPFIMALQFGGKFPEAWGGERMEFTCPDIINATRIQLRCEGVDEARHPLYIKDEVKNPINLKQKGK